jgi:hypothetical protein
MATIVVRDVLLCTIIYGGYHQVCPGLQELRLIFPAHLGIHSALPPSADHVRGPRADRDRRDPRLQGESVTFVEPRRLRAVLKAWRDARLQVQPEVAGQG